jgi:hypothetical protein
MCDCIKAAINNGYVIRGGTYDEEKHEFVDTDDYWMPLGVKDRRKTKIVNLSIKCCPICGEKLAR